MILNRYASSIDEGHSQTQIHIPETITRYGAYTRPITHTQDAYSSKIETRSVMVQD